MADHAKLKGLKSYWHVASQAHPASRKARTVCVSDIGCAGLRRKTFDRVILQEVRVPLVHLKVSGKWLSPKELEKYLLEHSDVDDVAVVGVRTSQALVKPSAFVVLGGNARGSDTLVTSLQKWAKERLEPSPLWRSFRGHIWARSIAVCWPVAADSHPWL